MSVHLSSESLTDLYREGRLPQHVADALAEQAARWKAESRAAFDAQMTRFGREAKAEAMRELDLQAARMKGAACSTRRR